MKKTNLLAIALFLLTSSCFGRTVTIVNNSNASGGWRAKIESGGSYITGWKYMISRGREASFSNIPTKCTIQIVSRRRIGSGTALTSGNYIILRKDIDSPGNITININESTRCDCENGRTSCSICNSKRDKNSGKFYMAE